LLIEIQCRKSRAPEKWRRTFYVAGRAQPASRSMSFFVDRSHSSASLSRLTTSLRFCSAAGPLAREREFAQNVCAEHTRPSRSWPRRHGR